MKRMTSGTAIALVFAVAATTQSWTGARGQGVPVSNAPPVVAANANTRIDVTQGGTPIVNIATPRADGTSYNVFSKLNVGKEGLIFNNSKEIGRSQIGGQILSNSRLKNSGEASLILNEVTGGTRSDLRGALEVFGGRASLIIANPSGITCDGCGFINVSRAALSTGKITFGADGAFTGFAVDGGNVRIEGQGLLGGNVDFFDIVTGSAIINANLFARDLVISGGSADFDFASRTATERGTGNDRLAIDSSLLGGMYANRIRLIGTGKGVGINLQGLVNALEGPLAISADGAITLKSAAAASDVSIASKANVNIDERVYGGGATRIDAAGNIVLAGDFVGAANAVSLNSGGDIRLGGAGLYAGLSSAGRFDQAGTLTINAAGSVETSGVRAIASEGLTLDAQSATLAKDSSFSARDISIKIGKSLVSDASIEATGDLSLSGDALQLGGDLIANGSLAIDGRSVALSGRAIGLADLRVAAREALGISADGDLQSGGVATLSGATIDNKGRVLGMGGARVDASSTLANSGAILSGGDASLTSGGDAALGGTVNANGKTSVAARGKANVTGTVAAAGDVALEGTSVALEGTLSSGANLNVLTEGALTTGAASVVVADGAAALSAKSLDASGYISSGGALDLRATDTLALGGQTHSGGALSAKASEIALGGVTVSDSDIRLDSSGALSASGAVSAAGVLVANAASITSAAGSQLVAGEALSLTSAGDIINTGALSGKTANLSAGAALESSGTLYGADALDLSAKTTLTQSGTAESGKALSLAADAITLSGKTLGIDGVSAKARTVSATGDLQSGDTLSLDASDTLNTAGSILSVGELTATSGATFVQAANIILGKGAKLAAVGSFTQNGTIEAAGTIDLSGSRVSGGGALSSDASISVRALSAGIDLTGGISAKSGILFATASALSLGGTVATDALIDISASDVQLAGDIVASSGFLTRITGGVAIAKTGALRSGNDLALDVTTLANEGLIESAGTLDLKTQGSLTNRGTVSGTGAVTLAIGRDLSGNGVIQAGKTLGVTVTGDAIVDGAITAAGDLAISANRLVVNSTLASGGTLNLSSVDALNISANGTVSSQNSALLGANSLTNDGQIISDAALTLTATAALTNNGTVQSGANLNVTSDSIALGGSVASGGAATFTSAGDTNVDGRVNSAGELALTAATARIDGRLQSNSSAIILANIGSVRIGGTVLAAQDLSVTAVTALDLSGTVQADKTLSLNGNDTRITGSAVGVDALSIAATGDFTTSNRLATNGALSIDAGNIALGGTVDAGGLLALNAADTLLLTGTLFGSKTVTIGANILDLSGTIQSVGALGVKTLNRTDIASGAQLLSGDTLRLDGGRAIASLGIIASRGSATFNAANSIATVGRVDSGAALDFDAQTLSLGGTLASEGGVNAIAGGVLGVSANLSAKGAIALDGAGVNISGTLLTQDNASITAAGALDISGTLSADKQVGLSASDLNVTGQIVAKTGLVAQASNIVLGTGGDVQSGAALALDATQALTLDGTLLALDALTLSGATSLDLGGSVQSGASTTLAADGALTTRGSLIASGDISARAATASLGGSTSSGGTLSVSAAQASVTGRLAAKTAIDVRVGGAATLALGSELESDGSVSVTGANISANGTLLSGTTALLNAATTLDQTGRVEARDSVTFASRGALTNSGTVLTLGTVTVTGGAADLSGDISANTLSVSADALRVRGKLSAGQTLDLIAANALTTDATAALASGAAFGISAGTNATLGGRIDAGGRLTVSAGDTLSVTGVAQSGAEANLRSRVIALDGSLLADASVSVDAVDALSIIGSLSGVTGLTARGGSVDLGATASLRTNQDLGLTSDSRLTNSGEISARGAVSLSAGAALANSGSLTGGDALTLSGDGITLDSASVIATDGALTLSSSSDLNTAGSLDARGATTLSAATTIDQDGALRTLGAARLTAGGALTGSGSTSTAGTLDITAASIILGGALTADGQARLTSTIGDVSLGGELASSAGITLSSAGDVALLGRAITDGALTLSGRDIDLSDLVIGRTGVTLGATRALSLFTNSVVSSDNRIDARAASLTNQGTLSATNAIDARITRALVNAGVIVTDGVLEATASDISNTASGQIQSGGSLSLTGSGTVTLGGRTSSGAALDVSGASLAVTGDVNSSGALSLTSSTDTALAAGSTLVSDTSITTRSGAALSSAGAVFSAGSTRLDAGGALGVSGTLQSVGDIALAGAALDLGGAVTTDAALSATTTGTLALGGALQARTALTLSGGVSDFAAGSSLISGGSIAVSAANLFTRSTIDGATTVNITSTGDLISGGDIASGTALTLNAGNSLTQSGLLDSGSTLSLSGGSVTLANTAIGVAGITVEGGAIALTSVADLRSGAGLALDSRGALTTAGSVSAHGDISLIATSNLTQSASVASSGAVSAQAGATLTNSGTIDAARAITLSGNSLTNSAELASEQSVSLNNRAGTAALGGTVSGKTGVSLTSAGDVAVSGRLVSGTTFAANVTGTLTTTTSGELLADGDISLSATTAIANAGVISTGQALNFTTPVFSSIGALESGRAFALSAGSITLAGRVASTDAIMLSATNGALDLGARLQGTDITLSAIGGDLTVRSGQNIDATGLANLTSNRNITLSGIVTGNAGVNIATTGGAVSFASGTGAQSLADVRVSASGAVFNAGTLTAGGGIDVSGSSISSGAISADGGVALSASDAISVNDIVNAGTSAALTSTAGAINVGSLGAVLSGGTITLTAATDIGNAGELSAETSLDATAGGSLTNEASGFIFSRLGNTRLGGTRLSLGGDVYSSRALTLNANDISISGSVGGNNALTLKTGANLGVLAAGLLQSNGTLDLTLGTAQIDGTLRALGTLGLSASGLSIGALGLIEADTSLTANVSGALDNRGQIGVTGTLALNAGTLTNSGVITATSDAQVSGGSLDVSGLFESGRNLSVTSNSTTVSATGAIVATGSLGIDSDSATSAGSLFANGALSVTGRSALNAGGDITSNLGSVTLNSGGAATIAASIDAKTSTTITGASVALSGDVVADGAVGITATSGALGITSNIDSGTGIALRADGGALTVAAPATLFAASGITGSAQSVSVAGDLLSPGAITLAATNTLGVSGNLISNSAVGLTAGTALVLDGNIDAASANLAAANLTTRGNVDVAGAAVLSASNGASIEGRISAGGPISFNAATRVNLDVTSTGRLISGSAITLQNVAALSVSGLVSAATDVSADFAGVANLLGRVEAGNNISLTNNGNGATSVGGVLAAGNDIVINGGTLSVSGLAYAGRDFSFTSTSFDGSLNSLTVNGTLAAGRDIALNTAGGLRLGSLGLIAADRNISSNNSFADIAGSIAAGGSLGLTTRGDNGAPEGDFVLTGSLQSTGLLSIAAARSVAIAASGRVISDSSVSISGPSIDARGTIGAGDSVSLSGDFIIHGGLLQSGRRIAVNATQNISLASDSRIETVGNATSIGFARDAGASANIDIRAGGIISATGTIYSDGAIAIKSDNREIINSGTITGLNDVVLQADNHEIFNSGSITGTNLAVYQGRDFNNSGSFTAAGNLLLSAPSITNSGLLGSGGNLVLLTPGSLTNHSGGTIFAGGALGIEAGGGITNDLSTILAVGNIGLTAPSLLNNSARIESLGGSITIQAQDVVNQIKNLSITPSGVATPAGLFGNDGALLSGTQGFDITTCSGGGGFLYRCFGNSVEVRVSTNGIIIGTFTYRPATAGGDDSVTTNSGASAIVAAHDVTITTGSNALGTVTNSNSSILAGNNISITAGTLNNVATLLNRNITRDIIEVRRQRFVEDANIPCPATAIPGTCMTSVPPEFRTTWEEFVDVVVGQETVQVQEPLPTLINAGGTVLLDVGTLNNNQPALNGQTVVGTGGGTPGVFIPGASAQGGRGGFVDPNAPAAGVTGALTAADLASGGRAAQSNGIAVDLLGGGLLNNSIATGNGAGTIGAATAAMVGAGGALLDAGAAGTANSAGTANVGDAGQRGASVGVILADGSAGTGTASAANGSGAGGANTTNLSGPGALSVGGTNSGGGSGVGIGTGTPGGFVNSLINAITGSGGPTANGTGAIVTGVAGSVNGVQTARIAGVDAVDPNANATADLIGTAAQTARLVDGFGGLAIPGIFGANGQAGSFVFDFLRSFGLTAGADGFGIAGGGGLFTFNNNPDSQFLFTTNPGFASVGDLFDSNFFFEGLGIDRSTRFTRLGDGFFEAQLIGKQVQAATGQAQLGAFGDAFAQARGLLEAGLAEAKRLQLSIGVALTAAQVADLKTSLVWYVKSTVQGREVLVPVVYLAASDQKSIKNGAIISGSNVVANVRGTVTNNGAITAKNVVSLTAGGDILNQAGGRIAGGTVIASAARDILAAGGSSISGGNILLSAGRDISLSATTATTSTSERKDFGKKGFTQSSSTTQTVTGAEIAATGNLVVSAGRDLTLTAAKVSAGGDASLSAGRDVTITGVTTTDTTEASSRTVKKGFLSKKVTTTSSSSSTETFNGTTLTAGGNLSVSAGNTLTVKGSDIAAGGSATLTGTNGVSITSALENSTANSASKSKRKSTSVSETASTNRLTTITSGGNLTVGAAAGNVTIAGADLTSQNGTTTLVGQNVSVTGVIDSATFAATSRTVKKGLASKKVTTTTNNSNTQAVVASTVSGDRVNVVATGGDVTVKGANIVSDNGTLVQATGNITIGTLEAKSSESQSVKVKKSGISISGAGLFAGVAKSTNASTLETTTNTGSLIGSANGDVTVNAGNALTITGSQVAAPGTVNLIGESVTIQNATDTANATTLSKSSSFGVSLKVNSPLIAGVQAATSLTKTATSASSARTQAVAGVAGALAVANSVDAAKDAVGALKGVKSIGDLGSVSVSVGFSKSKSTSASTDQTVVGSQIAGGDVNIIARGAGDQSTIAVIGSSVTATRDLTLSAPGAISFTSAQEVDTSSSKNKSVGVDIGVTLSASGLSPNASLNLGKGNSSGRDVTNIESVLSAGGTARVVTPGVLTLEGAQLSGNRVEVQAGSLAITSQQDTSVFKSKQTNVGVSVSADFKNADKSATNKSGFAGAGASLSFGQTKQSGDFASVQEQSGIKAGSGGFDIKVAGATSLTGAVIASEADAANNQLTTGTLSATDLTNREKFKASSINLSASISGIGKPKPAEGTSGTNSGTSTSTTGSTQVPADAQGRPTSGANRTGTTAGLRTGIGTIAAGAPSVASASGSQSSTTLSAIATGGITITSGDTASLGVAQTISRDTSAANEALTKQFTDAKRQNIAEGFAAAQALTQQVSVFFSNRAQDEAAKKDAANSKEAEAAARLRIAVNPDAVDDNGRSLTSEQREILRQQADTLISDAGRLRREAEAIHDAFKATSPARIIATALTGAAGSNVSGSLSNLVQGAAVNVLQSLAVSEVKRIADRLVDDQGNPTAGSESVRAALQSVVGCVGSAAGGSNNCGSAAAGAAASVVVNYLLTTFLDPKTKDPISGKEVERTIEETQARTDIVATLVAGIAAEAGLDVSAATAAAQIETENNAEDFGLQFDDSCRATNSCNGIRYQDYQTIQVGDLKPDGTRATQADVDFARRAYQRAFYSLALSGNAVTPTNVRIVLEAVIGGDLDDQRVSSFLNAYGGPENVAALVTSGRASATTLARQFTSLENLKRIAFEQTPLSELNRYAADPAAFRALSSSNPQYATQLQLAFAYSSENTTAAAFSGTGSFGDRVSLLNREFALTTRGLGLLQGVGSTIGGLGAGAGAVAASPGCATIVGCAPTVGLGLLAAVEADQALAGFRTFFTGNSANSFLATGIGGLTGVDPNRADLVIGLSAGAGGIAVGARTVANSADNAIAETFDTPNVFDALGRTVDEAAAARAVPQVTFNQIAGSQFERQVLDALGHVGATKNTIGSSVTLADGSIVNTIVDSSGRNVGGLLEIKNVQELNFSDQIRAQLRLARETEQPLNIVVSPTTTRVTRELQRQVNLTGRQGQRGGIFVFDPATGLLRPFGN